MLFSKETATVNETLTAAGGAPHDSPLALVTSLIISYFIAPESPLEQSASCVSYAKAMPAASDSSKPTTSLQATYKNPTSSETFTHSLPSAQTTSTKAKTAYLSALRSSVVKLQEDVNGFLTSKMEEDKTLGASAGMKADDKVEEDNYGEERVEEED